MEAPLVGLVRLLGDSRRRREVCGDEADVEVDPDGVGDLVLALLVPEALYVFGDHRPEGRIHVRTLYNTDCPIRISFHMLQFDSISPQRGPR